MQKDGFFAFKLEAHFSLYSEDYDDYKGNKLSSK